MEGEGDCWHFTQKGIELEYVEIKQLFYLKLLHKLNIVFIVESSYLAPLFLYRGSWHALLPGPSYLESSRLCQWDTDAGTECLMLPVVSVIPDASGIGYPSP